MKMRILILLLATGILSMQFAYSCADQKGRGDGMDFFNAIASLDLALRNKSGKQLLKITHIENVNLKNEDVISHIFKPLWGRGFELRHVKIEVYDRKNDLPLDIIGVFKVEPKYVVTITDDGKDNEYYLAFHKGQFLFVFRESK